MARRAASGSRATSTPATRAVPEVIVSSVVSMRIVVDLPAPFGPRKAKDLAGLHLQVDPANGIDNARPAPVILDQPLSLDGIVHGPAPRSRSLATDE